MPETDHHDSIPRELVAVLVIWVLRLKKNLGVDSAIAYIISARIWSFVGNIGTVLLMLHFLSPLEQGYYFTLISLAALQAVFELGFSFVILQMAAHERAHLTLHEDGSVEGDPIAHARLASVLQLALRWYARAAILLGVILLPAGMLFFSRNAHTGQRASWLFPWILSAVSCSALFMLNPVFSFIEGCGEVSQVARLRLHQCIANTACAWGAMLAHHGLFAPGMIIVSSAVVGSVFIWRHRKLLAGLLRYESDRHTVNWRCEIWPFQWKIAVSWLCTTYTVQIFTPILFHFRGPVEAGQMGMSISITGYISAVVLSWMSTKASPFGLLIAQGRIDDLNHLFKSSLQQSMSVLLLLDAACMAGVFGLHRWFPHLAQRIVPPSVFALLLLATLGTTVVQSQAIYLRSFKREPFLGQSSAVAILTVAFCLVTVERMGQMGISLGYLICAGAIGVISGTIIQRSWTRKVAKNNAEMQAAI
jgi:hypothetical protein